LLASEGNPPKVELEKMKALDKKHQKQRTKTEYRIEIGTIRERMLDLIRVLDIPPPKVNRYERQILDPYYGQSSKALDVLNLVIGIISRYDIEDAGGEYSSIFSIMSRVENYNDARRNTIPTN